MREIYDFRIFEDQAYRLFEPTEGKRLGRLSRKIIIQQTDPRFPEIGRVQDQLFNRQTGEGTLFFAGWNITRKYTQKEIERAALFLFHPLVYFEPSGRECGTRYEDKSACRICGAGEKHLGPIFLQTANIPERKDIAVTFSGEIVVSQRFVDICKIADISGASFNLVREKGRKDLSSLGWYELCVLPPYADIAPPTRTGITPFDQDEADEYRCKNGDTIGLNLLSEISIDAESRGDADILATAQFIGQRLGALRPRRQILISQKVRRLFEENEIRGYQLEVAHLV